MAWDRGWLDNVPDAILALISGLVRRGGNLALAKAIARKTFELNPS